MLGGGHQRERAQPTTHKAPWFSSPLGLFWLLPPSQYPLRSSPNNPSVWIPPPTAPSVGQRCFLCEPGQIRQGGPHPCLLLLRLQRCAPCGLPVGLPDGAGCAGCRMGVRGAHLSLLQSSPPETGGNDHTWPAPNTGFGGLGVRACPSLYVIAEKQGTR